MFLDAYHVPLAMGQDICRKTYMTQRKDERNASKNLYAGKL